ncbi:Peptide transporter PTR2 [Acorus gramineus]|uniref:Peptide transporter PTR2 n=1 Tax=Acorus gramineus TaxID=55184 RepID=A0AAV9A990_ACOGR|nr:Peptide transporter PTR2 [Acorus gramineus]
MGNESLPMKTTDMVALVSNGCVDVRGRIADKRKTGGWKASPFIIMNEVAERLAFYAIAVNLVTYLIVEMHQPLADAATHVTDWIGAAFVLTLLGAFLADSYLGRFKTILIFSCIYAVGMVLLTLSASIDSLRPPPCTSIPCIPVPATARQKWFLYSALGLIALGTGGIKPCVSSFGADQFDEADKGEAQKKYSFFNWFFFAINMGALLGITAMVYLQVKKGWVWGFAVPSAAMFASVAILLFGIPLYRYQRPMGSAFTRFAQVLAASIRNYSRGVRARELYEVETPESDIPGARKLFHTQQYEFLDKAAVVVDPKDVGNRWRLCTVTQVEELKSFIRVLPVWASTIALAISFAQLSTFFVRQAVMMDRKLGGFEIPASSVPVFARGITSLQRMGVGLFVSIFAMVAAAVVEKRRRESAGPMSVFWLLPQYFLIGSAEVFTYVGQLEFFYDEATDGTRSLSSAMFLSEVGIGSWLSTALVKIIEGTTGGEGKGWLQSTINKGRIDYLYWVLCGINGVNLLVYLYVAVNYKGRSEGSSSVVAEDGVVGVVEEGEKLG